jgi:hypothetical protein
LRKEQFIEGATSGTLKSLFEILGETDVLLSVGP